jgi:glycosyltransferase involved in cell wall biosynthesis
MKILIVQDRLRSGGTERQSILLANAFAAAGHDTTLLTFRPGGALAATVTTAVTRRVLQPVDTGLDWLAPRLYRIIAVAAPDIILCMGRMANCYAGGLQERFPATTVIATMRTGKKLPRLFRRSLGIVRAIVANSHDASANLIAHYGIAPERVTVIHNSLVFPASPITGVREKLRTTYSATEKTVVLLCVAMFRPEKNQRELIEIVAQLPGDLDWQLWLGGDGAARDACEKRVAEKSLDERVKFLGWQRDPSPFYAAADLAVHASSSEALSNFLIEAQASGLPSVAYDAQGIAECFVPGDTGFVIERDNREAFCHRLVELAQADDSAKAARSSRARDYARNAFDHDQQVTRYLKLFASLPQQKRA